MARNMNRRKFIKVSGVTVESLAAAALAGCNASNDAPQQGDDATTHQGKGHPRYNGPLNQAQKTDNPPDDTEALAKFVVFSDSHVDLDKPDYVDRLQNVFEDIAQFCPNNDAIIVNGDITNNGELTEYQKFAELAEASGFSYPEHFVLVIGNHDQYDSNESEEAVANLTDRFRDQVGLSDQRDPYYERTVSGVHLIMMGPDRYPDGSWNNFAVSDDQVHWMEDLVQADKDAGQISLVFLHEPLHNTVRNTEPGDFGHTDSLSDADNDNLHQHIRTHDNMVFLSGHTYAMPDTLQLEGEGSLYVGTGSTAYCIDNADDDTTGAADISTYGSLGWEMTVWESCIRFRLRNFLTHSFEDDLGSATYQFA